MAFSERKTQAIYDAVHDVITRHRLRLERAGHGLSCDEVDTLLLKVEIQAGSAAVNAYKTRLQRREGRMAKCARCGAGKLTERPCPNCGGWSNV